MKKLKCWNKTTKKYADGTVIENYGKKGNIKNKISVYLGDDGFYRCYLRLPMKNGYARGKILYTGKSKSYATHAANKYMEKHDKCR